MPVDKKTTLHLIKDLLKGGTPKWYAHPEDYRAKIDEWHKETQEAVLRQCREYRVDDQELLSDPTERRVNMMPAAVFMGKLRKAGLTCFSHDSQLKDGTASLFVLMPTARGGEFTPMCSIQVPMMYEWTTLRVDPNTGIATSFRDIGWRSAVKCMIANGALSEWGAHAIFGTPREARVSRVYRQELYHLRNQRSKRKNAA